MVAVRCRECGSEVSRRVKTCPHCGVGNPDPDHDDPSARRRRRLQIWFFVFSIPIVFFHLWGGKVSMDRKRSSPGTTEPAETTLDARGIAAYRAGKILEERAYSDYAECDSVAKDVAQKLTQKGVQIVLEQDRATELTIYTGLHGSAVMRFSCVGALYKSEIIAE
jgi:hypothetical protein